MNLPDPKLPFSAQAEDVLLAMCVFGEARGESEAARLAVAHVVRNRVLDSRRRYGHGWRGVILKPRQFSCFLARDPNAPKLLRPLDYERPEVWQACWAAAHQVLSGAANDNTVGSTHYFDDSLLARPPRWAKLLVPTVKLGRLNFFRAS